jgi:hypothetical protein
VTVPPSVTVTFAGEKQNSAPPQPVDWIVTVGSLPVAADAGTGMRASDPDANANDANSKTSLAPNLRITPPHARLNVVSRPHGRDIAGLHTRRRRIWFSRNAEYRSVPVNAW